MKSEAKGNLISQPWSLPKQLWFIFSFLGFLLLSLPWMYVNALKVLKKLSYSTWSRSGKILQLPRSSIFQNSLKFCFLQHFSTLEQVNFPWDNGICKHLYDTCLKKAHIDPGTDVMIILPKKHTR